MRKLCCILQVVAWRGQVPPGADHKSAALSTPQICLQKFKMKYHVSCFFKDIKINKAWKSHATTLKLIWVLVFIVDYESGFFCLSPPFSSLIFLFFALCMHVRTRYVSSNFLPCWFLVCGKPTVWHFHSLLIPGDQTKKGCNSGILLTSQMQTCMLKVRVGSPSLTK